MLHESAQIQQGPPLSFNAVSGVPCPFGRPRFFATSPLPEAKARDAIVLPVAPLAPPQDMRVPRAEVRQWLKPEKHR